MQVLNIDAFAEPKRVLNFKGKSYEVRDLDVQLFIDNLKMSEELEAAQKTTAGNPVDANKHQLLLAVDMVCRSIPTLPREEALTLNLVQLTKILDFIRGDLDVAAKQAPAGEAGQADATKS